MDAQRAYQVYTKRKLPQDPYEKTKKIRKRLGYREFRESELDQLNEVLHDSNIDLKGNYAIKQICFNRYLL